MMKDIVSLKQIETEIKKKFSPDTFEKSKSVSPQLHQSYRVLNVSFTDIQRKRKGDICSRLGRHFKQFSQLDCSEQYLFDEPGIKRSRAEMKNIENNKQKPQLSSYQSKTWSSSKKTESVPYYHITRATTITTNNNTRPVKYKTSKNVIKKVNFNIDITELHIKVKKFY